MTKGEDNSELILGPWAGQFLRGLAAKGGSPYTERNYRQALVEFAAWAREKRGGELDWTAFRRDDFRYFLRSWAGAS
jgi:hypothetical protein